jgi:integrase
MLARFRNGCLTTIRRKDGTERWLFRWRERCTDGTLRERNKVIGTVEEYPTKSKKLQEAVTRLRVNINTDGPTELTSINMAKAVEHYSIHELVDRGAEGKAYSTRSRKTQLLSRWVLPQWGKVELRAIKTVAVEQWLRTLVTTKLASSNPLPAEPEKRYATQ